MLWEDPLLGRYSSESRRQKAEGRKQKAEAEGGRQKAEGRKQKAESRRQKAEGRRQKAEVRNPPPAHYQSTCWYPPHKHGLPSLQGSPRRRSLLSQLRALLSGRIRHRRFRRGRVLRP